MRLLHSARRLAVCGVLMVAAACAGTPTPSPQDRGGWLKLEQGEKRFAIFTRTPAAPVEDGIASIRLVYVYMPETVQHEGKYVGWQEYPAMAVNCAEDTVKVGPRTRYAPDNSVMMSDDNQEFSPIYGPAIRKAADFSCKGEVPAGAAVVRDKPDWMVEARQLIAATDP